MTVLPYGHKYKKSTGYAVFSNTSLDSFFAYYIFHFIVHIKWFWWLHNIFSLEYNYSRCR